MLEKNFQISLLLDFYGELLSDKQREITENYYNNDLSLAEVAANTGITRQGVRDTVKRTEAALFEMEEKIGLYKRSRQLQAGLSEISVQALKIAQLNEMQYKNDEISRCIRVITDTAEGLKE